MHYANGREAHVGDRVVGKCFNTPFIVAGTLVSLTPGPDACSAKVGFLVCQPKGQTAPNMLRNGVAPIVQGCEQHGSAGAFFETFYCEDYSEAKMLMHADDANQIDLQKSPGGNATGEPSKESASINTALPAADEAKPVQPVEQSPE